MSLKRVQFTAIAAAVIALALSLPFTTASLSPSAVPSLFVDIPADGAANRTFIQAYVPSAFKAFSVAERCGFNSEAVSLTLRLVCGRDTFVVADTDSPFSPENATLYGATNPKWRTPLLKFFLAIGYFPGLGRLGVSECGTRFIACGEDGSQPFASFRFHGNTLLAALSSTNPDAVRNIPTSTMRGMAQYSRDFDGTAKAFIRLPSWMAGTIGDGNHLSWKNTTATALAMDSSSFLLFLPQRLVAELISDEAAIDFNDASGEDAVAYLSDKPYGGSILGFALPSATVVIPGLKSTSAELAAASARYLSGNGLKTRASASGATLINWTGKAMRLPERDCGLVSSISSSMVACTSSASFEAQSKSQKTDSPQWRKCRSLLLPSTDPAIAFAFIDMAPLADQFRSLSGIVSLLASFNVLKLEDSAQAALASANMFLSEFSPAGSLTILASRKGDGCMAITLQMTPVE